MQQSTFIHPYTDEQGDFYCRAVHGILNEKMDQQVCGQGCPCYLSCSDTDTEDSQGEVCAFFEEISGNDVDNIINKPEVLWKKMEQEIADGTLPLFPVIESKNFSPLIIKAFEYAARAHKGQTRKGTKIPYFTHLVTTFGYALQLTDDEEVLAGAILHDTVEDTWVTVDDIEKEFGARIASFVAAETENKRADRPAKETWEIRKLENVKHLKSAIREVKMIALSDKTANAESMLREWKQKGDKMWEKFNQHDKYKQAWYYYACKSALGEFSDTSVMKKFDDILEELFTN